jgi:head-tail adaptor
MTPIDGSTLRIRVRLERPQAPNDELGGGPSAFDDVGGAYAEFAPLGEGEQALFEGIVSQAAYRARLRTPTAVRSGWRLRWGGRTFRVRAMRDGAPLRHFVELALEEEFR